eukprot:TRINITY_DN26604_c0_g1_i4.p1 TRINITY_DN26604_c0_g1~~TRINITY_DN26604_c0_g1_i4.p1  ORF type:complete len:516 (+),score=102.19 TRINITY_DN26604_c0_g1_i4:176-1723(+)
MVTGLASEERHSSMDISMDTSTEIDKSSSGRMGGKFESEDAISADDPRIPTGQMSVLFAGITLACSQIGSALVALPSMMQQTLIVPGAIILIVLGLIVFVACYHLQQLWIYMRKAQLARGPVDLTDQYLAVPDGGNECSKQELAQAHPHIQYFSLLEFIAHEVFGDRRGLVTLARRWTLGMQVIALGGTAVSEVIQVGSSMHIATGSRSCQFWAILLGAGVMTPLTWIPDYKKLERLSLVAVVAIIFTAAVVIGEGATTDSRFERCSAPSFQLSTFFVGFSNFVFIWGGLALVPEVQSSMQQPRRLVRSMGLNLVFCLAVTLPTGLVGLNFCPSHGDPTLPSNVLTVMPKSPLRDMAAVSLSVHMIIAFAVLLMPLMEAFEANFQVLRESLSVKLLARTGWAMICVFIAVAIPFFSDIVAVVASIAQVYLSFVAPPLMFVAIFKDQLAQTTWGKVQIGFALGMAGVMLVLGTGFGLYASIYDLQKNVSTLSLIHISEPTRLLSISYAVFCLKKKN